MKSCTLDVIDLLEIMICTEEFLLPWQRTRASGLIDIFFEKITVDSVESLTEVNVPEL